MSLTEAITQLNRTRLYLASYPDVNRPGTATNDAWNIVFRAAESILAENPWVARSIALNVTEVI